MSLPSAATLPYTYKPMPSSLPPSSTGIGVTGAAVMMAAPPQDGSDPAAAASSLGPQDQKPRYVVSGSGGHAAHPDEILSSCAALQAHVARMQDDAERELRALDERIRARELAEKRRVAPGWLDSEARLLEPERHDGAAGGAGPDHYYDGRAAGGSSPSPLASAGVMTGQFAEMSIADREGASEMAVDQGAELDRAFGGIK